MTLPVRRWLYHTPPEWVGDATYFITICCRDRKGNQLCLPSISASLLSAVRTYHEQARWYVSLWLLMPDHMHALVAVPREEDLAKTVTAWKRFTSRQTGLVWQRGFFDHRLRHDESFEEKAHYIRMNPVRRKLAIAPEDWTHVWSPNER